MVLAVSADDPSRDDVHRLLVEHRTFCVAASPICHVHALDAGGGDLGSDESLAFYTARRDGELLGVGALKRLDDEHAELKAMHVRRTARGGGVGRALVDHLLATATHRGFWRVSLETGTMAEFDAARQLYADVGFTTCEPFGDYTPNPYSTCMTIDLAGRPLPGGVAVRAAVFVEGESDRRALAALAARRGRSLDADGVAIVTIGGATNLRRFLDRYGPSGLGVTVAGLCDAAEEQAFSGSLAAAGYGRELTRADLERLGFFVCDADLETELIAACGVTAVEQILADEGELGSFRTFQRQPAQRDRTIDAQLHRFLGTRSGRKVRYATLLVDALDLDRVPRPLDAVLAHV